MKIGTSLFRYCHQRGVWQYRVTGILKEKGRTLIVLSCDACSGGWCSGCQIYIDKKTLRYVMGEGADDVDMWHERSSNKYHLNKKDAVDEMYQHLIGELEQSIKDSERSIISENERIEKLKEDWARVEIIEE